MTTGNKELEKLNGKHQLAVLDYVTNGTSNIDLSIKFGFSENYISTIKSTSVWKKEESRLREEILAEHKIKASSYVGEAIATTADIMRGVRTVTEGEESIEIEEPTPPATRLNASKTFLEMNGLIGGKEKEANNNSITLNMFRPPWAEGEGDSVTIEIPSS